MYVFHIKIPLYGHLTIDNVPLTSLPKAEIFFLELFKGIRSIKKRMKYSVFDKR